MAKFVWSSTGPVPTAKEEGHNGSTANGHAHARDEVDRKAAKKAAKREAKKERKREKESKRDRQWEEDLGPSQVRRVSLRSLHWGAPHCTCRALHAALAQTAARHFKSALGLSTGVCPASEGSQISEPITSVAARAQHSCLNRICHVQKRRKSEDDTRPAPAEPPWLAADIRVRIVDKALRGGALYLQKVARSPLTIAAAVSDPLTTDQRVLCPVRESV